MRIEQNLLKVPACADIVSFIKNDGQVVESVAVSDAPTITYSQFCDAYLLAIGSGAVESNTLGTTRIHLAHFAETLGEHFPVTTLRPADLQRHITRRSSDKGRGGKS